MKNALKTAFVLCIAGLLASAARAQPYGDPNAPIATVAQFDIRQYAGLWYEIARFPNRFERGCTAVTADYALLAGGDIAVTNTCRQGTPQGPVDVAQGRARIEGPGQLSVNFVRFLPFIRGDYFVLSVDPAYTLAVVGEPGRRFGWILARRPVITAAERTHALSVLERNGYDIDALEWVVH